MKKIIFFDIDGTLADEETGYIPPSTIRSIHQARQNGHLCIVNTGRPISTINQSIKDIGFDGFVCGCGTYIELNGEVLYHHQLSKQLRKDVINHSYDDHIDTVLEGVKGAYFPDPIIHPFVQNIKDSYQQLQHPISTYQKNDDIPFDKFASWYHQDSDIENFKQFLQPYFHIIQRAEDFIEIVPLQTSKATGIQRLIDHLQMNIEQTISIGDSTNDLPMLEYTHESVAMGQCHPKVLEYVTYQTDTLENNGIEKALKYFDII